MGSKVCGTHQLANSLAAVSWLYPSFMLISRPRQIKTGIHKQRNSNFCHEWETNPVSQNHTNLSCRQERLSVAKAVGTAQVCRVLATRVRIQPVSPRKVSQPRLHLLGWPS